ncbi:hypothetical protein ABZ330_23215 [Streptomyces sp. NPDC006172]|uniref:hypothetical protein n=1 Tax=Streptomyces sp. NPDC006172 TaxID=3154470 RepID=UPI0033E01169
MFMRLCTPVSLRLAAAAVLVPVSLPASASVSLPEPAAYAAPPGSSCAGDDAGAFPLTSRIRGGPSSYRAGGGYGFWYLDLTNTTGRTCTGVHPVVVLVDTARALKPSQPKLEFYADGRPRPVRFETTDEDELVGALMDPPAGTGDDPGEGEGEDTDTDPAATPLPDFPGFTVAPGKPLTVKLRLSFTSDAVLDAVTLNAAVVQRHGDDGEWIGQSNDYRFTVDAEPRPPTPTTNAPATTAPEPTGPGVTAPGRTPTGPTDTTGTTGPTGTASPTGTTTPADPGPSPSPSGTPSLADEAEELALTGLASPVGVLTVTVCLIAAGAALVQARRRR